MSSNQEKWATLHAEGGAFLEEQINDLKRTILNAEKNRKLLDDNNSTDEALKKGLADFIGAADSALEHLGSLDDQRQTLKRLIQEGSKLGIMLGE